MMDQIYSWATIEAGENGMRNFGMPMKVERRFYQGSIWGFQVEVRCCWLLSPRPPYPACPDLTSAACAHLQGCARRATAAGSRSLTTC